MKHLIPRRVVPFVLLAAIAAAVFVDRATAWHEKEHYAVTALAGRLLSGTDLPKFFLAGIPEQAAHCAVDPDLFKHPRLEQLYNAEAPEHYLDLEYFGDRELPHRRYDYLKLCNELRVNPSFAGTLPYAIAEWTQRLTEAFAEHRADPADENVRRKILVYAGLLAHYAGDLHMPLHTTVHFDGRVDKPGDKSPRTGIHAVVDGLFRRLDDPSASDILRDRKAVAYDDLWASVVENLHASHKLVDRVYELEPKLGRRDQPITDPEVRAFAIERMGASAEFIASLYLTAWKDSADIEMPGWLDRDDIQVPQ